VIAVKPPTAQAPAKFPRPRWQGRQSGHIAWAWSSGHSGHVGLPGISAYRGAGRSGARTSSIRPWPVCREASLLGQSGMSRSRNARQTSCHHCARVNRANWPRF
jgi:hypothetical protein